jgi:hypothetical protein
MLLFRNTGPEVFTPLSDSEKKNLIDRWNDWFGGLVATGRATEGQPLEPETRVVAGPKGARVTDGPFAETKEAIGGYVKILARDLAEATAIAQQHPALANGMTIEIRALTPASCHLGVMTLAANNGVEMPV